MAGPPRSVSGTVFPVIRNEVQRRIEPSVSSSSSYRDPAAGLRAEVDLENLFDRNRDRADLGAKGQRGAVEADGFAFILLARQRAEVGRKAAEAGPGQNHQDNGEQPHHEANP
jgi:hypothetical protein